MSDKVLNNTLTITIGPDDDREEFIFRVPTPMDKARLGVREAALRRALDPSGGGWALGVDDETFFLIRGMATMETLLDKASVTWPYTEFKPDRGDAELRVDCNAFPPGKEAAIAEIGRRFQEELDRFHGERVGRNQSGVTEAVAGGEPAGSLQSVAPRAA